MNSKEENTLRINLEKKLLTSMEALFSGEINVLLPKFLRSVSPNLSFALPLGFLPEQGEDIYYILVNHENIMEIEIPRNNTSTLKDINYTIFSVYDYKKNLSSRKRQELEVALRLMKLKNQSLPAYGTVHSQLTS